MNESNKSCFLIELRQQTIVVVLQPCPHRCSRGGERCPATLSWRGWPQQHIHHLATSFWIYKVWHDRDRDGPVQSTRRKEDGGLCRLSIAWGPGQDCQVVFSFPRVSGRTLKLKPSQKEESSIPIFLRWDDQGNSTILAEGDQHKVLMRTSQLFQGFHLDAPDH